MRRRTAAWALVGLSLAACKAGKTSTDDAWWQIDGDTAGTTGDEDDDGDEEDEEDEAIAWGEVFGESGAYEGEGGVEIVAGGALVCGIFWEFEEIEDTAGCDGCDAAVRVTIGEVEVEASSGCGDAGIEPEAFAGASHGVGWLGESVLIDEGDGFEEAGEGWIEDGEMGWEIWLGEGEDDEDE